MDWVEDNRDNLPQSIVNSHLATALSHNVFTVLGWYLNACVCASYMDGLEVPGSKTECYLNHITPDLSCGTYRFFTHLPPSLKALLAPCDAKCVGRGLSTPGVADTRRRHKIK